MFISFQNPERLRREEEKEEGRKARKKECQGKTDNKRRKAAVWAMGNGARVAETFVAFFTIVGKANAAQQRVCRRYNCRVLFALIPEVTMNLNLPV